MQRWFRGLVFLATVGTLVSTIAAGGCGKSRSTGGSSGGSGGGGGGGGGTPQPTDFNMEIQALDLPATGAPTVTFKVTDKSGAPIDLIQEIKNGAAATAGTNQITAPRFTLAQLQDSGDYVSAYERSVTGKPYIKADGSTAQPALPNATQAVSSNVPTDATLDQRLTSQGNGVYKFQMDAPTKTGLDTSKTWTVGSWATRTLAAAGDAGQPAHATFNFVPAGGTAQKYEVVVDSACNVCHGSLEAHDRRTGTQLCITCHSPQTTDPESGNPVDFKVMIHKIHRGSSLPSVQNGTPFFIVGFAPNNPATLPASAIQDFSDVGFPRDIHDCTACHQGANADRWMAASQNACTSCHDNVQFANNAGLPTCAAGVTANCRHPVDIAPNTACSNCHNPTSVQQAHVNQFTAEGAKFKYEITGVTLGADRLPVVQFRVTDPTNGGRPYVINGSGGGTVDPPWSYTSSAAPVSGASRLFVDVGWPSEDYNNAGSGNKSPGGHDAPGQAVQINALTSATPVAGQDGVWQVTSTVAVPASSSFTVVLEGHPGVKVSDTSYIRIPVTNDIKYLDANGGANGPARRVIVATAKCNACHGLLSAHGSNRTGNTQVCAVCHNPDATDEGQRADAQTATNPPPLKPESPIDFRYLIHSVHADRVREHEFVVIGFGGSTNTFPIGFPNDVGNCAICHDGTTYQLPLNAAGHDTTVDTGANAADPSDNTRIPKTIAACTACHDRVHFDATAGLNACNQTPTGECNHSGGPQQVNGQLSDQSCAACHGPGTQFAVETVHPIVQPAPPATP